MMFKKGLVFTLLLAVIGCMAGKNSTGPVFLESVGEKSEAYKIVEKSESIYSGKDQISILDFKIIEKDGTARNVRLKRYWKSYVDDGSDVLTKTLIFHTFPPETKGTSFMVWSYKYGSGKEDDQWLYLPILRKVNKLPGRDDSGFHGSDLKAGDMVPRLAMLDKHKILSEESRDGREYYVVESIPKSMDASFPYAKVIKWINKENFQKEFVEYYDVNNSMEKRVRFHWISVGNAKVWEKVEIESTKTSAKTILNISDIVVDSDVTDMSFTERIMKLGADFLK